MLMPRNHHRLSDRCRAFTLIEASIATVIVAVMVAAALSVVGGAARGTVREREWRQGQGLATAIMSEVLAAPFSDPQGGTTFGIESGESATVRSQYDDLDDFDGFTEVSPADAAGTKIDWATGWRREVRVENVEVANPNKIESDSTNTGLRRVTVTVTSPGGRVRTLTALKARDTIVDAYTPQVGVSRVTAVRIRLKVGASGSTLVGGATAFNTPVTTMAAAPAAAK